MPELLCFTRVRVLNVKEKNQIPALWLLDTGGRWGKGEGGNIDKIITVSKT